MSGRHCHRRSAPAHSGPPLTALSPSSAHERSRNVQLARTLPQSPDSVQTYPRGAILAQKQTAKAADCHCHQASQRPSGSEVDLRQHLLAIWRIRWFTLAVAVGIGLAVYALQSFAPAKYRGDLTLSLQLPSSQGADPKPQADYSAQALVALANTSVVQADAAKILGGGRTDTQVAQHLSLIHISEPTRRTPITYAVFCLKK